MQRPILLPIFETVTRPIRLFFELEAASGVLLLLTAAGALVWANSSAGDLYQHLLALPLLFRIGSWTVEVSLLHLINDGLMTIFFFVVGMEIKRELVLGELSSPARAALPAIAAIGGMLVPSAIYLAFNAGGPGQAGWGIPMATDIAFCVGVLMLLKSRVPHGLVIFLTALAIFDDIGGILVIALFYGRSPDVVWLGGAGLVTLALFGLNRAGVRQGAAYALGGVALWYALHHGGIHPTIAGVILGLMIPARASRSPHDVLKELHAHTSELVRKAPNQDLEGAELVMIEEKLEDLEAPLERYVHILHPYVAYLIMPLFALANSGVSLAGMSLMDLLRPIPLGTALGLFLGKQLGIFSLTFASVRFGLAPMPGRASLIKLYGVSVVGGIGFTVALFVAALAFPNDPALLDQAKLGILVGSLLSGVAGYVGLRLTAPTPE